jgi:hypothetical protein
MQQAMRLVEQKGKKIFVDVDALNAAFEQGVGRFLMEIQSDPQLQKRVLHHSCKLFGSWTMTP